MTRTETTLIIEIREEKKITEKLLFFSCCWRTVDRNYGDADIEPTSTGGSVRQLTGFVFGCLNKFKTTFVCVFFFFWLRPIFCGLKHWKNLFWVLQVSAGRVCQVILCVCLCVWFRVCVVESLLCSEECQCASARVRPRHTVLASAKGQLISNTYFFFLSSSFVSHNLFRFWKKETFVIVWFLLEEKNYFFFSFRFGQLISG